MIKMLTLGEGVKNTKNLADVICERPVRTIDKEATLTSLVLNTNAAAVGVVRVAS